MTGEKTNRHFRFATLLLFATLLASLFLSVVPTQHANALDDWIPNPLADYPEAGFRFVDKGFGEYVIEAYTKRVGGDPMGSLDYQSKMEGRASLGLMKVFPDYKTQGIGFGLAKVATKHLLELNVTGFTTSWVSANAKAYRQALRGSFYDKVTDCYSPPDDTMWLEPDAAARHTPSYKIWSKLGWEIDWFNPSLLVAGFERAKAEDVVSETGAKPPLPDTPRKATTLFSLGDPFGMLRGTFDSLGMRIPSLRSSWAGRQFTVVTGGARMFGGSMALNMLPDGVSDIVGAVQENGGWRYLYHMSRDALGNLRQYLPAAGAGGCMALNSGVAAAMPAAVVVAGAGALGYVELKYGQQISPLVIRANQDIGLNPVTKKLEVRTYPRRSPL